MEIGQFTLTRRNGKCFDLYLGWLTNTEVSDCDCPRAAAAALREASSLRLTLFACPLEFTIPFCLLGVLQRFLTLIPDPAFLRSSC